MLVIPILRPIIPGMIESFLLVFTTDYRVSPVKRTAKIGTVI
jgi:hypothetical protein